MKDNYRVTLLYLGLACIVLSVVLAFGLMTGLFLGVICNSSIVPIVLFVISMLLEIAGIILLIIEITMTTMTDTILISQVLRLIIYPTTFVFTICIYSQLFKLL